MPAFALVRYTKQSYFARPSKHKNSTNHSTLRKAKYEPLQNQFKNPNSPKNVKSIQEFNHFRTFEFVESKLYMYIYIYVYICRYMCIYIYVDICIYMYIYVYICVYMCTYKTYITLYNYKTYTEHMYLLQAFFLQLQSLGRQLKLANHIREVLSNVGISKEFVFRWTLTQQVTVVFFFVIDITWSKDFL